MSGSLAILDKEKMSVGETLRRKLEEVITVVEGVVVEAVMMIERDGTLRWVVVAVAVVVVVAVVAVVAGVVAGMVAVVVAVVYVIGGVVVLMLVVLTMVVLSVVVLVEGWVTLLFVGSLVLR